jgi:hypothetical protein
MKKQRAALVPRANQWSGPGRDALQDANPSKHHSAGASATPSAVDATA